MKYLIYLLLVVPFVVFSQEENEVVQDSTQVKYIIIQGDSIPITSIYLDEVMLLEKLSFKDKEARRRYLILRRKTLKVYPYATLAAERLEALNIRLATLEKKRHKKRNAQNQKKRLKDSKRARCAEEAAASQGAERDCEEEASEGKAYEEEGESDEEEPVLQLLRAALGEGEERWR